MTWIVIFHNEFEAEFDLLSNDIQDAIYVVAKLLEETGPTVGRPYVDTLKGSKYANIKEMRVNADNGVWRIAFAFDPDRKAILLVGGDKVGKNEKRFYEKLISIADKRYENHMQSLKDQE
jgi:hypothetical protein